LVEKKLKNGMILSKTWGLVPTGNILPKTYTENSIAVGDAAGHVMASNGGGIPGAIICGDIGGEIISKKLNGDSNLNLSEYEKIWKNEIGKELETAARLRKIADTIMRSDKLMERILEKFGGRLVESILRCRMPLSFDIIYRAIDEFKKSF
jgi:digeranylgeranylglycerophospholipid reductase